MKKIFCLNQISRHGLDRLTDNYTLTDQIEEAEGVLVRSADMKELVFSDKLLAIARAGAGVNNIPTDRCAKEGIVVFNTPGANANGVKELFFAGILLAARDIVGGINWVRAQADDPELAKKTEKEKKNFAGTEIAGKKLGVIGLGAIGSEIANAATALGMEVYGYDPYISVNAAWNLNRDVHHITNPDAIYAECDYITVHVPAMPQTKGMVGRKEISEMKDGVVLLNFSRDSLVDEDAVAEALESGKMRRYVTDFPEAKSAHMKNAIVMPHLGASTEEAEDNCAVMAVNELMDYIENGNIKNSVNYPNCDMGVCRAEGRIAVLHQNIPNMLGQITAALARQGANIADLTNKVRGEYAYALIDLNSEAKQETIAEIAAIEGVCKVRVIAGGK
ncbi:MAG: phosphoglycerate dehydrogenase [Eubacteriales bacterium]|nr:phosphoglycerate dehydrogenase [Eubacteriales bacterium]